MNLAGMIFRQHLPAYNASYCWHLEWLFEDENCPPHNADFSDPARALDKMIDIWNSTKTLVHISLSRRNA